MQKIIIISTLSLGLIFLTSCAPEEINSSQSEPEKKPEIEKYNPYYRDCNDNIYCGLKADDPSNLAKPESEFTKENLEFFNDNKYTNSKYDFAINLPENITSFYVYNPWWQKDSFAALIPFNYIRVFYFSQKKCNFGYSDHSVSNDLFQVQIFDIERCNKDILDDKEKDFCNTFVFSEKTSGEKETKGLSYDIYFGNPVSRWVRNDKYLIFIKRPFCKAIDDGISLSLYK